MAQQAGWIDAARVVVIGGGVIGCSIAYHLARLGLSDVLVLERNELASGATSRSAGCLSHSRAEPSTIRMIQRTHAAIAELEDTLGESLDFRHVGCIRAAFAEEREAEMRLMEACLLSEGLSVEVLDAAAVQPVCPWLELGAARRIVYLPSDGYIDGARLAQAYARAARRQGARFLRGVTAQNILREGDNVCGVSTQRGAVAADWVVDAAGAWGAVVASWLGWGFAAAPTRSHYWITAPDGSGSAGLPNIQLPDLRAYIRAEVGGLLVGLQEPRSQTYDPFALDPDMEAMPLLDPPRDLDLLVEQAAALRAIAPAVDTWGFAHHIAGLSMYTPDGKFLLGGVPNLEGFLIAGGCCGSGVAASGGFGLSIAEIITGQPPSIDLDRYRPDRFGPVDPASAAFRDRCAAARSGKSRGSVDGAGIS